MVIKIIAQPTTPKKTLMVSSDIDYEQADLLTMWVISSSCRNKAGGISVACFDIDMFSNSTLVSIISIRLFPTCHHQDQM